MTIQGVEANGQRVISLFGLPSVNWIEPSKNSLTKVDLSLALKPLS